MPGRDGRSESDKVGLEGVSTAGKRRRRVGARPRLLRPTAYPAVGFRGASSFAGGLPFAAAAGVCDPCGGGAPGAPDGATGGGTTFGCCTFFVRGRNGRAPNSMTRSLLGP